MKREEPDSTILHDFGRASHMALSPEVYTEPAPLVASLDGDLNIACRYSHLRSSCVAEGWVIWHLGRVGWRGVV